MATWLGFHTVDDFFENDLAELTRAERALVRYMREDQGPHAHPLQVKHAPAPGEVFDSTSDAKGMMVLQMLETWLGQEGLRKGLTAYLETHRHGSATSADFFAAVGKATGKGRELAAFQRAWLDKTGYPIIEPRFAGTAARSRSPSSSARAIPASAAPSSSSCPSPSTGTSRRATTRRRSSSSTSRW